MSNATIEATTNYRGHLTAEAMRNNRQCQSKTDGFHKVIMYFSRGWYHVSLFRETNHANTPIHRVSSNTYATVKDARIAFNSFLYTRTTVDLFVVQQNYGQGWEDVTASYIKQTSDADFQSYIENAGKYPTRLIKREQKIDTLSESELRAAKIAAGKVFVKK